jgi:tetratricopeptide (TPR) repeat protein
MRQFKQQLLSLIIILYSCGQVNQNQHIESKPVDKVHRDTLFIRFDSLENKWNSIPVNSDTLYRLAKQLNVQADSYPDRKEIKLTDIYKRCADIYRMQQFPDCDTIETSNNPGRSELLCSKDTSLIIDCYKKAIEIFQSNLDSLSGSSAEAIILSSSFADVMFQMADVYEQSGKFQLALPYRQTYLAILLKTEKPNLEMVAGAYMYLGSNYELQKDYRTAYKFYLKELESNKADNYRNLKNVEKRIIDFKNKHPLE